MLPPVVLLNCSYERQYVDKSANTIIQSKMFFQKFGLTQLKTRYETVCY